MRYTTRGLDIGAGQAVTLGVNLAGGEYTLANGGSAPGTYDLELVRASGDGELSAVYAGLSLAAGESHVVDVANWDGVQPITIQVWRGGAGEDATSQANADLPGKGDAEVGQGEAAQSREGAGRESGREAGRDPGVPLIVWIIGGLFFVGLVVLVAGVIAHLKSHSL